MKNVTLEFGEYGLEEIRQEFVSTATSSETDYILPKAVWGTKVHLLLVVKNTRIQPILNRVLPSGVGVYLSLFKDVGALELFFIKVFTQANKEHHRESSHDVYSLVNKGYLGESTDYKIMGESRSESVSKIK